MQDYSRAPNGETYNPPTVAIGPDDFTCSAYISGIGTWPTVSYTGAAPWYEQLALNRAFLERQPVANAAEPFWDIYEHGRDGQVLGSCWIRGSGQLTCGDEAKCTYTGGAGTGVCCNDAMVWYCYSALCGS